MEWKRLGQPRVFGPALSLALAGAALVAAGRLAMAYRQRPSAKRKATSRRSTRAQAA